jgi:Domain of unknown function (DUF5665)
MQPETGDIIDTGYDIGETQQQRLITVLSELEEEVEKQNSLAHKFVSGALYGLGTVIGATLLIAIFGSVVAVIVRTLGIENIPILGDFVEKIMVEQIDSPSTN